MVNFIELSDVLRLLRFQYPKKIGTNILVVLVECVQVRIMSVNFHYHSKLTKRKKKTPHTDK